MDPTAAFDNNDQVKPQTQSQKNQGINQAVRGSAAPMVFAK